MDDVLRTAGVASSAASEDGFFAVGEASASALLVDLSAGGPDLVSADASTAADTACFEEGEGIDSDAAGDDGETAVVSKDAAVSVRDIEGGCRGIRTDMVRSG